MNRLGVARVRRGEIKWLTGIDDPREEPVAPEIGLTTTDCSPVENARKVMRYLAEKGILLGDSHKKQEV